MFIMSSSTVYTKKPFVQTNFNPSVVLRGPKIKLVDSLIKSRQTLHSFALLPYEIKEQIWQYAAIQREPRVIELGYYHGPRTWSQETPWQEKQHYPPVTFKFPTKTVVPATLHVCRQSRAAAMTFYNPFTIDGSWAGTYVDWQLDYLYLNWTPKNWHDFYSGRNITYRRHQFNFDTTAQSCQHLLFSLDLYEDKRCRIEVRNFFQNTPDIAVLCAMKREGQSEWKSSRTSLQKKEDEYEGGNIQLFDIQQGFFGPVATTMEINRTSTRFGIDRQISPDITLLLGYQRRQAVSEEELSIRTVHLQENPEEFPRPKKWKPFDRKASTQELRAELKRYGTMPWVGSDRFYLINELEEQEPRMKKALKFYKEEQIHYFREIYYNSKPGRQIHAIDYSKPRANHWCYPSTSSDEDDYFDYMTLDPCDWCALDTFFAYYHQHEYTKIPKGSRVRKEVYGEHSVE